MLQLLQPEWGQQVLTQASHSVERLTINISLLVFPDIEACESVQR